MQENTKKNHRILKVVYVKYKSWGRRDSTRGNEVLMLHTA